MGRKIEFLFDDVLVKKVSKDMSEFEKKMAILICQRVSNREMAEKLKVPKGRLLYQKKKKILDIAHEIRDYEGIERVSYGKIDAFLIDCVNKYICPQKKTEAELILRSARGYYN